MKKRAKKTTSPGPATDSAGEKDGAAQAPKGPGVSPTATALEEHEQRQVPVADVRLSPTNPPARTKPAALEDLVASVRAHGVLAPVLVREIQVDGRLRLEVVAGNRRVAAARLAGLDTIPAVVRYLSDADARVLQLVENLQRQDVTPLEEAAGYRDLLEAGQTADGVAASVGKSRSYVYGRLKLLDLGKEGREALEGLEFDASVMLLVARMPRAVQAEGLAFLRKRTPRDGALSFRAARDLLEAEFMFRLSEAPWKLDDAELVPKAGACSACPKRTGNAPDLFGDVKGANVCTDGACYRSKVDAHAARAVAAHVEAGGKVLEKKTAAKLFEGDKLAWWKAREAGWIDVDEKHYGIGGKDGERTWAGLLKSKLPDVTLATDEEGNVHRLAKEKELQRVGRECGAIAPEKKTPASSGEKRQRERAKLKAAVGRAMVEAVLAAAKGASATKVAPIFEAYVLRRMSHDDAKAVVERRALDRKSLSPRDVVEKAAKEAAPFELALEVCAQAGVPYAYDSRLAGPELVAAAKVFGVNLRRVAARAAKEHKAGKKKGAPKAEKPARKKA
jgi:ParB/RepB/Spo0J family partition protein